MQEYWLNIKPNTFIWIKGDYGIVYNSENYRHFVFKATEEVVSMCKELMKLENLYTVTINDNIIDKKNIEEFVNNIISIEAGNLIDKSKTAIKPVSLMPVLKIQENIETLRIQNNLGEQTNDILRNLTELTIHLNGDKNINPKFYKQFTVPSQSKDVLSMQDVIMFMDRCCKEHLLTLNLVVDFTTYQDNDSLIYWLNNGNEFEHYNIYTCLHSWLYYIDVLQKDIINKNISINIVVDNMNLAENSEYNDEVLNDDNIKFFFPVISESEYESIIALTKRKKITQLQVIPFYNGNNIDFFEKYVFITKEDLASPSFCKREIFANQTINNNFFGKFTVMPDRKVYANLNYAPVGNIRQPIYDLIFRELDSGKSWLMIRDKGVCKDCIYQWMCPSPSNYEIAISRDNLCTII